MKTKKTIDQYFVGVLQKYDLDKGENRYYNAIVWYPSRKPGQRYVNTIEDAQKVLKHAYKQWNSPHRYNSEGRRYETSEAAPGIGISLVCTPETDNNHRIVKHIIKHRTVTEWDVIEEEEA